MSRTVNKVILLGNLTRDAETSYTSNQTAVTKFSVATSERWKDKQSGEWKEQPQYTNVQLWRSEKLAQYLTKGSSVYVEGHLQTRDYEKDGRKVWTTEVIADNVILLGGKREQAEEEPF